MVAGFEVLAVWGTVDHGGVVVAESEVLAVWGTVDHGGGSVVARCEAAGHIEMLRSLSPFS